MLKNYQKDTLNALEKFLSISAKTNDVKGAYAKCTLENFEQEGIYNDKVFKDEYKNVPYICLRLPTGGGKTFLAAHSIPIACREYLGRDFCLVIWLVPSTAILEQTYNCLNDVRHPYRQALDDFFDGSVNILKIEDALNVTKSSLQGNVNVIVTTYAAFRVERTEGRKVYQSNGALAHHFEGLSEENLSKLEHFKENGVVKKSLANVISLNNPLIIVDEAHNARTDLTFDTIERLNPSCLIEFTATPNTQGHDRSNVLFRVSAATLKSENMIKMPIELLTMEDWQTTLSDSVNKRNELEKAAKENEQTSGEYIRPIVLIQAQNDSEIESTINTAEIKKFLLESCNIPNEQVAIATGEQKGIEGINLSERNIPIRYIITKQALKEGWDCPFAYVFCSVANITSSKDVEQLLGRVLRMPNVEPKSKEELNKAYAYVSSKNFYQTANNLADSLTRSGFDSKEASELIEISPNQGTLGDEFFGQLTRTFISIPELREIPKEVRDKIEINKKENTITFKGKFSLKEKNLFKECLKTNEDKEIIENIYDIFNGSKPKHISPQKKGITFSIPQLLLEFDNEVRVFDEECLLPKSWNLAQCNYKLSETEFHPKVDADRGLIDLDSKGRAIIYNTSHIQLELSNFVVSSKMDEKGLIGWLIRECRDESIPHAQSVVFINKAIEFLIQKRNLTVQQLIFKRMLLRDVIKKKIKNLFNEAKKEGYQTLLSFENEKIGDRKAKFSVGNDLVFPAVYPVNEVYNGNHQFGKHYYDQIGKMNNEEAECAFNIDNNNNVEMWLRNLEKKEDSAFWLQTSTDKFYPDFIVQLKDGRLAIVEYKSSDRYSDDDSKEKRNIGDYYASLGSKIMFKMLKGPDWHTLNEFLKAE